MHSQFLFLLSNGCLSKKRPTQNFLVFSHHQKENIKFHIFKQFCRNFICKAELSSIPSQSSSCITLAAELSSHVKQRIASGNLHSCLILPSNGRWQSTLASNVAIITPTSDPMCAISPQAISLCSPSSNYFAISISQAHFQSQCHNNHW